MSQEGLPTEGELLPVFFTRRGKSDKPSAHTDTTLAELSGSLPRKHRLRTESSIRDYLITGYGFVFVPKTRSVFVPSDEYERHAPYKTYLEAHATKPPEDAHWLEKAENELAYPYVLHKFVLTDKLRYGSIEKVTQYTQRVIRMSGDNLVWTQIAKKLLVMREAYGGKRPSDDELRLFLGAKYYKYAYSEALELYRKYAYLALPFEEKLVSALCVSQIIVEILHDLADARAVTYGQPLSTIEKKKIAIVGTRIPTPRRALGVSSAVIRNDFS